MKDRLAELTTVRVALAARDFVMDGTTTKEFSRRDFIKGVGVITLSAFLASCVPGVATAPTVEPVSSSTPESGELEKITKGVLSEVSNPDEWAQIESSLPSNKPEVKGGASSIDIFKIKAGTENFKFAIYELTPEEIANQPIIELSDASGKKIDVVQSVAMYAQSVGTDGKVGWERLVGIVIPQNDKVGISWIYDSNGFPEKGSNKHVDLTRPVLGYFLPLDESSAFSFSPLTFEASQIVEFNVPNPLTVTSEGKLPANFKVLADILPSQNIDSPVSAISTATPETFAEISQDIQNPENLPKTTIENFTSREFDKWVKEQEAEGKFPKVPDTVIPFTTVGLPTFPLDHRSGPKDDGMHRRFVIPYKVISEGTYFQNPDAYPGIIAAAWNIDVDGEPAYGLLYRYKNADGTYGFHKYVTPKQNLPLYAVLKVMGYEGTIGVTVPEHLTDKEACKTFYALRANGGNSETKLCGWVLKNQADSALLEKEFYKKLKAGMWDNNLTNPDGSETFFIPTAPLWAQATNAAQTMSTLEGYSN